ncbi:MAG: T9SS type A sorting domain-containing protein [Paludibacter sp.]|nr:T9SS type A sorting domain-containing protein [Paludibacter sp.]
MLKSVFFVILSTFITYQLFSQELNLNDKCQAVLSNSETGLVASVDGTFDDAVAERNAKAITTALSRLSRTQDLLLPEGIYYVNTILVPKTIKECTIAGAGMGKTILIRSPFSWDNNTQGDCPLRTEVFLVEYITGFELCDMTIDGSSQFMAISGYGKWNTSTGEFSDGLPQFPTYKSNDGYSASSGSLISIRLSNDITFETVEFKNGYGWCILLGKINGFTMRNSIIDTGNLSTEFKGHFNTPPNNQVMHMHTSQDGLHMVNVSNVLIEYNDIHSEDSAIAIELNPSWNWGGYDVVENVVVRNNYVSTMSPSDPEKLMNDDDVIYGTRLANVWMGQSAVDIFYNENFDAQGSTYYDGRAYFRNIEIYENAFENVRQGVRCGFFIGASLGHFNHRIFNLTIKNNTPAYMAGRNKDRPAGIRNVFKNSHATSWNKSGGAGIAVRYADSLTVSNNHIENCVGGLGISIENVTNFTIVNNYIDKISGKSLGDLGSQWTGGEGIRINNRYLTSDPNLDNGYFNAGTFLVAGNSIGDVETTKIAILTTKNGIIKLNENYDLNGVALCALENGIYSANVTGIGWGSECNSAVDETEENRLPVKLFPGNNISADLLIELLQPTDEIATVDLFNMQGTKIYTNILCAGSNLVPMRHLPNGIYLLSVDGQKEKQLIKLIKHK